jgi:hypothetical protein
MNQEQPPQELTKQVQELVNIAFTDSPEKAIQQARDSGSPALMDALHAALSEASVHEELIRRGKVQPGV